MEMCFFAGKPPVQEAAGEVSRVIIKDKGNMEAEAPRKDCLVIVHMRAWTADISPGTLDEDGDPINGFLLDDAGHFRFQWGASVSLITSCRLPALPLEAVEPQRGIPPKQILCDIF